MILLSISYVSIISIYMYFRIKILHFIMPLGMVLKQLLSY